jgi:putative sigma-54 modulation protein
MELSINVQNLALTPRIEQYVNKKVDRLDRYLPSLVETTVELSEQNARNIMERQVAQITVRDKNGTILRAEERSGDIFAAIDAVIDKIHRQISRYRGKQQDKRKRGQINGVDEFAMAEQVPAEALMDEEEHSVVRRKLFSLRPMTVEEAADQMDLLGHDFFVFFNGEADEINVIYRRRDQNYGLLAPDMG